MVNLFVENKTLCLMTLIIILFIYLSFYFRAPYSSLDKYSNKIHFKNSWLEKCGKVGLVVGAEGDGGQGALGSVLALCVGEDVVFEVVGDCVEDDVEAEGERKESGQGPQESQEWSVRLHDACKAVHCGWGCELLADFFDFG